GPGVSEQRPREARAAFAGGSKRSSAGAQGARRISRSDAAPERSRLVLFENLARRRRKGANGSGGPIAQHQYVAREIGECAGCIRARSYGRQCYQRQGGVVVCSW